MPKLRVLTLNEASKVQRRSSRAVDMSEYESHLRELAPGQIAEAVLTDHEKKATVKGRITRTSSRLGVKVKYYRSKADTLVYEVTV